MLMAWQAEEKGQANRIAAKAPLYHRTEDQVVLRTLVNLAAVPPPSDCVALGDLWQKWYDN
jgi:hypothetical protein